MIFISSIPIFNETLCLKCSCCGKSSASFVDNNCHSVHYHREPCYHNFITAADGAVVLLEINVQWDLAGTP